MRQVNIKTKRVCNFVPKINKLKPLFFALIWALVSHPAQILLFFERKLEPSPSVAKSELLSFACFFRLLSEFKAPFISTILARYGHRYSSSFLSLFIVCLFGRRKQWNNNSILQLYPPFVELSFNLLSVC